MKLKTLSQSKIKNKRVLLRCGFDVPFNKLGKIQDDERIKQSLPTLRYLIKNKAKVIIISHNGRPNGKKIKKLAMDEVAKRLGVLLKKKVIKLPDCCGKKVTDYISKMKPGQVVVLENLRFYKEEGKNMAKFAKALSELGEVYVNDAFANSHRQHASMVGIPKHLPSYAGFLVQKEVESLSRLMKKPKRPFVAVVGGAKISDKLGVILNLFNKVDALLLGGALANTILKAQKIQVGKSLIEPKMITKLSKLDLTDVRMRIPVDVMVMKKEKGKEKVYTRPSGGVGKEEYIYDIGPDTITLFISILEKARQIVWAGPMGYFEDKRFSKGSYEIAKAIGKSKAYTVVGGGDTVDVLDDLKIKNKINFISTGGGAMLRFLQEGDLPALKLLK